MAADDYSRMARQKCVMNAMLQQLSPATVITKFEKIAKASEELITTDLPASELGEFAQLAMKARAHKLSTVSFVPPEIATSEPDIAKIRTMVKKAIARSDAPARKKTPAGSGAHAAGSGAGDAGLPPATTGGSIGSMNEGYAANQAADLSSAC